MVLVGSTGVKDIVPSRRLCKMQRVVREQMSTDSDRFRRCEHFVPRVGWLEAKLVLRCQDKRVNGLGDAHHVTSLAKNAEAFVSARIGELPLVTLFRQQIPLVMLHEIRHCTAPGVLGNDENPELVSVAGGLKKHTSCNIVDKSGKSGYSGARVNAW